VADGYRRVVGDAMSDLMRVEISRATWLRGQAENGCLLLNGQRCCLGFVARQAGLPDEEITGWDVPSGLCGKEELGNPLLAPLLERHVSDEDGWTYVSSSELEQELVKVNDDVTIDDAERERRLIDLARQGGYKFVFVD
jgi:hypothetical protein